MGENQGRKLKVVPPKVPETKPRRISPFKRWTAAITLPLILSFAQGARGVTSAEKNPPKEKTTYSAPAPDLKKPAVLLADNTTGSSERETSARDPNASKQNEQVTPNGVSPQYEKVSIKRVDEVMQDMQRLINEKQAKEVNLDTPTLFTAVGGGDVDPTFNGLGVIDVDEWHIFFIRANGITGTMVFNKEANKTPEYPDYGKSQPFGSHATNELVKRTGKVDYSFVTGMTIKRPDSARSILALADKSVVTIFFLDKHGEVDALYIGVDEVNVREKPIMIVGNGYSAEGPYVCITILNEDKTRAKTIELYSESDGSIIPQAFGAVYDIVQ